ncbi:PmoA family protein [Naasia sp. SYSU D00057]|uniref:DUF6807 domain-containing protein n=1 Tax=Naasia sp. SYSU D00057 TaxID=2817380 RepID=UPI001B3043EC|nr:PmoA family protein [Naasia sp. SYSU D00057]
MTADTVDLTVDGTAVATIVQRDGAPRLESPRPYLHPIRSLAGRIVSDHRPADHAWHWGLSLAVANLAVPGEPHPVNLWGGVTFAGGGYVQLPNNGSQDVVAERRIPGGLELGLEWRTPAGRAFLRESRRMSPRRESDRVWVLDWESRLDALEGPLGFGSPTTAGRPAAGYGGLFLRLAPSFADADVILDEVGRTADDAMGRRGSRCALRTAEVEVALEADPRNPVASAPWFVRTGATPMLCAAPFFDEEWRLGAGESATWRWRLRIEDLEPRLRLQASDPA